VYRTSVQEWEQVTVPAGSYRALRIEVTGDRERMPFTNVPFTGRFQLSAWYAPDVKRYVRLEHKIWAGNISGAGQQSGHEVVELLKYLPGS
jgi:hypothetical protein